MCVSLLLVSSNLPCLILVILFPSGVEGCNGTWSCSAWNAHEMYCKGQQMSGSQLEIRCSLSSSCSTEKRRDIVIGVLKQTSPALTSKRIVSVEPVTSLEPCTMIKYCLWHQCHQDILARESSFDLHFPCRCALCISSLDTVFASRRVRMGSSS